MLPRYKYKHDAQASKESNAGGVACAPGFGLVSASMSGEPIGEGLFDALRSTKKRLDTSAAVADSYNFKAFRDTSTLRPVPTPIT